MATRTRTPKRAKAGTRNRVTALSIVLQGDEPPNEFRIFTSGKVETTKGTFTFDEEAAKSVMAEYAAHGIDLMLDYAHASIDADVAPDPANAGKAAGWFNLEVREGELWATNVRWTEAAAEALRSKEWRFMSPAFEVKEGRIATLLNVALTNIPATRKLKPLVAAARDLRKLSTGPAFGDIQRALLEVLSEKYPPQDESCSGPWLADVFDATVVFEVAGKLFEVAYAFDGTVATLTGTPAEVVRRYEPATAAPPVATQRKATATRIVALGGTMDPKLIGEALDALIAGDAAKCQEILKGLVASAAGGDVAPPPPAGDVVEESLALPEEKKEEVAASLARLMRLSGKKTFTASIAEVEIWRASHIELETERQKLAKERETLEAAERRAGCVKLVTLAGYAPSSVWADDKATMPKKYLASMPLSDFNDLVSDAVKSKGSTAPVQPPAAVGAVSATGEKEFVTPLGTVKLSAREQAMCVEMKQDPAEYASRKAAAKKKD